jgi:hypothetical protein
MRNLQKELLERYEQASRAWLDRVGATLGWQSYGNVARAMIANSSTKLGWLASRPAPGVQTAPDMLAPTPAATASSDNLQQLAANRVRPTADGRQHRQTAVGRAGDSSEALSASDTSKRRAGAQTGCDDVRAITRGASAVK